MVFGEGVEVALQGTTSISTYNYSSSDTSVIFIIYIYIIGNDGQEQLIHGTTNIGYILRKFFLGG